MKAFEKVRKERDFTEQIKKEYFICKKCEKVFNRQGIAECHYIDNHTEFEYIKDEHLSTE